ncbi:MAG: GNAT family N-acetyltransferase [Clostridia bacterium]|nr:GNAT family N-acetyltransferase [Clostridia bacterium]
MIKTFHQISKVKKEWIDLYSSNQEMSVYQSYEWNRNLFSRYKLLRADKQNYDYLFVACFDSNGSIRVIAPLTVPNNQNEPIMIGGGYTKTGLLNFIYAKDIQNEEFNEILNYLYQSYPNHKLAFREIPRETRFGSFLYRNNAFQVFFSRGSVRCSVPQTKEQLDKNLSKSVRQTIRTSYNRMRRNSVASKLEIHFGYKFQNNEKCLLNDLQKERKKDWGLRIENENGNALIRIKQYLRDTITDPLFRFSKNKDFVYVKYIIDNQMAAFFIGLRNERRYCIVPTLIHNKDYKEYNPGLLMIYEFLCEEINTGDITVFDLSRGVDDYKLRYLPLPEIYEQDLYDCDNDKPFI